VSWIGLILAFALFDNVVLARLLGVCPCAGAPRSLRASLLVGIATTVLMSLSSFVSWVLQAVVLQPLGVVFLRLPAFVIVSGVLALFMEAMVSLISPALLRAAGFSIAGTAVNCATLGVALLVTLGELTALGSLVAGLAGGLGFLLVLALMSAIRERMEAERVPRSLRGLPLSLISAGLLALAFAALDRPFLSRLVGL
jgi:electron transport complex protein RnfA